MGTPISGKGGKILVGATPVAEVEEWELDEEANKSQWVSSDTGGFQRTLTGALKWNGSLNSKFDMAASSVLVVGAAVALKLYLDSTHFYSGNAAIVTRKTKVDLKGEVIGGSFTFDGDGALSQPTLP